MSLAAKCCLCTDEFSSIDDLEAHISADHFNCLPFECEKCKYAKFPTEFAIKRHYEEDHGLVEYFVRYRVSREIYEKKQKVRECLERCVCHSTSSAEVGNSHQNSQQQISGTGKATIAVEYSNHPHQHQHHHHNHQYQTHHDLHENEFLTSSKGRRNAPSPPSAADLFQSAAHRTVSSMASTGASAELRHHQSELLGAELGGHHDNGFDQVGHSGLMGNILEHIKPDMDGHVLSHFDQLYAAEEGAETKGILGQHPQEHELASILHHPKNAPIPLGVGSSGINVVNTGLIGKTQHSTPVGIGSRKPPELQCQVCKQMVVNRSTSLMYHVNVKHLKLAIFKCKQCGEEFLWNRPAANRHAKRHGGDESLIENNTERLFPILNRHRREYFNLSYGKPNSISPIQKEEKLVGGEEQKMDLDQQMDGPKEEESNNGEEHKELTKGTMTTGKAVESKIVDGGEKEDQTTTPNTILAQLIDMTSGSGETMRQSSAIGGGGEPTSSNSQQTPPPPSLGGGTAHEEGTNKVQKTVKCDGCGDSVINQEWILLNHVNTKHLHLPLYKCVSCDKPFENYLRSYAVRHAKFYHAGDESLLLDQRDQFWTGLREACSRLFGIGKAETMNRQH